MCDPIQELSNAGKTVSKWGEDFDHSLGVSAVSREATNAAKAIGSTVEAIAQDPRKLAAVGIMIAFPAAASTVGGYLLPASVAASYPTMAAIVGQTAINAATNGGDVKQAVTSALIQQGAPELVKELSKTYATEGISQAITDWAAKATVDTGIATALGKDPGAALLFGGVKAATNAVLDQTEIKNAINYLPKEASSALKSAITAKVMGIDPTKAVAQDLVNQAIGVAQGMAKAQNYATYNKIPAFTEKELSKVDPDILSNSNGIQNFVNDTTSQREGWDGIWEKTLAAREGVTDPTEFKNSKSLGTGEFAPGVQGTIFSDGKFTPYGESKRRLPTAEEAKAMENFFNATHQDMPEALKELLPKDQEPEETEKPVGGLPVEDKKPDVAEPEVDPDPFRNVSDNEPRQGGLPVEDKRPDVAEPEVDPDPFRVVSDVEPTVGALPTEPPTEPEELKEPVGGLPTDPPQSRGVQGAIDSGRSGDRLGEINELRDIVGLPRYNTIEEYNADKAREAEEENQEPVGGLPTAPILDNEFELPEGINPNPILDNEFEAPSILPTDPILDNELELPEGINPTPVLDNELELPEGINPSPILDDELEDSCAPGFHRVGDICVADDDEPPESTDCPDGYIYDFESKSCVPMADFPGGPGGTKPPATKPPATKPPATKPPATTPPGTKPPATTPTTPTGGLPATAQSTSPTIPWLDTKPQMLEVKGGAKNTGSDESLQQLYKNVDPSLMSVFADRGFTPYGYSEGSSVSSVFTDFTSSLEKGMPKFTPTRDAMISTGPSRRKEKQSGSGRESQLPQLRSNLSNNAKGGLPAKYAQAAPKGHNPEFITGLTGFYANGKGTGQSDDIPAMLHDGDYVMDADTVAALGDGSSKAGALSLASFQKQVPHEFKAGGNAVPAKIADGEYVFPEPLVTSLGGGDNKKGAQMLDSMREEIRAHKRSAPTSKIPPKAKSPLDYLKMVKG